MKTALLIRMPGISHNPWPDTSYTIYVRATSSVNLRHSAHNRQLLPQPVPTGGVSVAQYHALGHTACQQAPGP